MPAHEAGRIGQASLKWSDERTCPEYRPGLDRDTDALALQAGGPQQAIAAAYSALQVLTDPGYPSKLYSTAPQWQAPWIISPSLQLQFNLHCLGAQ